MSDAFNVLAVDPSLNRLGYCLARITQLRNGYKIELVEVAHIPNKQFEPSQFGLKLNHISRRLYQLRDVYRPSIIAKEDLATNSHSQTEKLSPVHALIHMIFGERAEIVGYSPSKIKKDTSEDGKADKKQVEQSVIDYINNKIIVPMDDEVDMTKIKSDDESDSIAILITLLKDRQWI